MKLTAFPGTCAYSHDAPPTIAAQMRAFLGGDDNGAALLHALYDHILDEPVPERLRAVLKH